MSEQISLIEKQQQHALSISKTAGTMQLGKVMGPSYQAIIAHLEDNGIKMSEENIPFTKYNEIDWEKSNKKSLFSFIQMMFFQKWVMNIGIPCPESVPEKEDIKKMTLEAGKYLRAIHKGPYMKVGDTYKLIQKFAEDKKLKLKNYSIEFYLNDPREVSASDLETEVLVPVK